MRVFVHAAGPATREFRATVCDAARVLGHAARTAEDVGRSADDALVHGFCACDVIILLVGAGDPLPEPESELDYLAEWEGPRRRTPAFAFVMDETRGGSRPWVVLGEVAKIIGSFATAAELRDKVLRVLHEVEVARTAGDVDNTALVTAALHRLAAWRDEPVSSEAAFALVVAADSPTPTFEPCVDPTPALVQAFVEQCLSTDVGVLRAAMPFRAHVEATPQQWELRIAQGQASIRVALGRPQGCSVSMKLPLDRSSANADVASQAREVAARWLRLGASLIDSVDPEQHLHHVAVGAELSSASSTMRPPDSCRSSSVLVRSRPELRLLTQWVERDLLDGLRAPLRARGSQRSSRQPVS
jgi:hypothetical protein